MNIRLLFLNVIVASGMAGMSVQASAQISKSQALSQLSSIASKKVQVAGISLDKLLSNESNDLIIEYNVDQSSLAASSLSTVRNPHAPIKSRVKANHAQGNITLRDYYALPVTLNRISDRETLLSLLDDANVKAVYPNRINQINLAESLPLIRQPDAVAAGFDGSGASIAVLDTGVDYTHSAFGSCIAPNSPVSCKVAYAADFTASDDGSRDDNGHGTNVSGIASGVASEAKILGLDVFTGGGAYDSDIIAALNWSLSNATTYNIKAVNLSLGISGSSYNAYCSSAYTTVFSQLKTAGVAPVVASGNNALTSGVNYPACTQGAVVVGAVYDDNVGGLAWTSCTDSTTAADQVTCFSNSGDLVTLFAPGALITAAGYTYGGTSQATPHVAGAIAVLRASTEGAAESVDATVDRLKTTGVPVTDGKSGLTRPRIDLYAAVASFNSGNLDWLPAVISYVIA